MKKIHFQALQRRIALLSNGADITLQSLSTLMNVILANYTGAIQSRILSRWSGRKIKTIEKIIRERSAVLLSIFLLIPTAFAVIALELSKVWTDRAFGFAFLVGMLLFPLLNVLGRILRLCIARLENVEPPNSEGSANDDRRLQGALYLRQFRYDQTLKLTISERIFEANNSNPFNGAQNGGTIESAFVRSLGYDQSIFKLAGNPFSDFTISTVQFEIGDPAWQEHFKNACEAAKTIVVLPLVSRGSALLEEIKWISRNGYLYKTVFLMPTKGKLVFRSGIEDVSESWEKSGILLASEAGVILPKFVDQGGIIAEENANRLVSWSAGQIWFSRKVLKSLVSRRTIKPTAFQFAKALSQQLTFLWPVSVLLLILIPGFLIGMVVWIGTIVFGSLSAPEETSIVLLYILQALLLLFYLLSINGIARRFATGIWRVLVLVFAPSAMVLAWLSASLIVPVPNSATGWMILVFGFVFLLLNYGYNLLTGWMIFKLDRSRGLL